MQELYKNKIITQIHYINSFLCILIIKKFVKEIFKVLKEYYSNCISLPIFANLTKKELNHILKCLDKILIKNNKI